MQFKRMPVRQIPNFTNPEQINIHLKCSICLQVFEQPQRLMCGHTFCFRCINLWAKEKKTCICAQCKVDCSKRKPEKDLITSKMVNDLDVRCIHQGCKWTGQNWQFKKHHRKCEYNPKKKQQVEIKKAIVLDQSNDESSDDQIIEVNQSELERNIKSAEVLLNGFDNEYQCV